MMLNRLIVYLLTLIIINTTTQASEGMWLPILLKKYNIEQMQQQGFKLTADDIYDINKASLKDAVVGLVRLSSPFHHFCTGDIISSQGLMLTNHHCGYGAIQSHSSIENDYLTNGFWAMNKGEELSNDNMGVCFLRRIEDVTAKVMAGVTDDLNEVTRDSIIDVNITKLEEDAVYDTHLLAKIKPFFAGNEYYMSVYEIFKDIRLVGAPPSAIGKFGGDTDNWMWPRHTGDFSLFRIYADTNNEPADYSDKNVPYKPKKHLEIAIDGVEKGDFTMVMGYPGTTTEYLPSFAVSMQTEVINPIRIKVRTKALDVMKTDINSDAEIRIKYSAKSASMANGWKKWIGENRGLKRMDAIGRKDALEDDFEKWANKTEDRKAEYGDILSQYKNLYAKLKPLKYSATYFYETILGAELIYFSADFRQLLNLNKTTETNEVDKTLVLLKTKADKFYKDYNYTTSKKIFSALVQFYYNDVASENQPEIFKIIDTKFKGNIDAFADYIYEKSLFSTPETMYSFINNYSVSKNKKIIKDPALLIFTQTLDIYHANIYSEIEVINVKLDRLNRVYIKGLREFNSNKALFPDANSTFRIAYGQIDDYNPRDAVSYFYQTTLKGIVEKDNPDIYDYDVPDKLKELYNSGDFGRYTTSKGEMPVCFTASNHTTGGNSGSPVLNAYGRLVGINFDRNWEGTMSDIMYDPDMCRNITLDIRYVLFIIDKFANASHLVDEMTLVRKKPIHDHAREQEYLPEEK